MNLYKIKNTTIVLEKVDSISLVDEITFPNGIKQDARIYIDAHNSKYSFQMESQEIAQSVYDDICSELENI